jgi:hypothetical protein
MLSYRVFLILLLALFSTEAGAVPVTPAVRKACIADAKRLCSDVLSNEKARQACMRKNRARWSAGCEQAVQKMMRDRAQSKAQ